MWLFYDLDKQQYKQQQQQKEISMNCLCSNTSTQMNHLYRVGQHSIVIHGLVHPNTNTQDHNACLCIKQIMTKGLNALILLRRSSYFACGVQLALKVKDAHFL